MSAETTRPQTFAGSQLFFFSRAEISRSMNMPSQNVFFNKNWNCSCILKRTCSHQIGREEIVQMLCLLLTSCCFEGSQSTGGWWRFIIHEKIALLCSSQEWVYSVCIRSRSIMMHQRQRQSANAIVKMRTTWYLSFVPLISARAPKEFFYVAKEFQRIIIRFKYSNIWNFTACMVKIIF